jgi:nitrogen-specific signal transduction histidine kinase/CheY-like chemotaxis protein
MTEKSSSPSDPDKAGEADRLNAIAMVGRGVAHDINNLMETVLGNSASLRGKLGGDRDANVALDAIEISAEQAGRLTERILAITQGDGYRAEIVNVNSIVYHLLLVEESNLASRIRIVRHVDPDLWKVCVNHTQVAQVLLSLATNAVEAIQGNGRVTIRTNNMHVDPDTIPMGSGLDPGPYVLITIEDDGEGMSDDILSKIFEPGFTTKPGHAGKGLVNVFSTIRNNRGFVTVNSFEKQGTVFRVYLPAVPEEAESQVSTEMPKGRETILIVDDENMIADAMAETLKRLGYRTLVAYNGKEAVDIARRFEDGIDLALLDMAMPEMTGADAYPLLKKAHPEMRFIICTGFEKDLITGELMNADVDSFLLKPFRMNVLAQEVRKVLDRPYPD